MSERKLLVVDVESTGTNSETDRVIELAIAEAEYGLVAFNGRFNPGVPIPKEASAVHNIFDHDVANCPTFRDCAASIHAMLEGCDLLGFGLSRFDIPILAAEFRRAGIDWDFRGHVIDVGTMFQKLRPRKLENAVQEWLGRPHGAAHSALGDTIATLEVFRAMCRYEDVLRGKERPELAAFSQYGDMPYIDIAGKLVRDSEGFARYNFGRSKGTRLVDDIGLAQWMMDKDFSANTLRCVREELAKLYPPEPEFEDFGDGMFGEEEEESHESRCD